MALADTLAAPIVRPVHVGYLDFKDDPIRGWTGPGVLSPSGTGDADLDGNSFLGIDGPVAISDFSENMGIGEPLQITFAAGDMEDEEVFKQLVVDKRKWMGRKAKFWLMFLNADESAVLSDFTVLFNGVMVGAKTQRKRGEPSVILITCDADTQKAHLPPLRWIDHASFYSGDTASTYINSLGRVGPGPNRTPGGLPNNSPYGPF